MVAVSLSPEREADVDETHLVEYEDPIQGDIPVQANETSSRGVYAPRMKDAKEEEGGDYVKPRPKHVIQNEDVSCVREFYVKDDPRYYKALEKGDMKDRDRNPPRKEDVSPYGASAAADKKEGVENYPIVLVVKEEN